MTLDGAGPIPTKYFPGMGGVGAVKAVSESDIAFSYDYCLYDSTWDDPATAFPGKMLSGEISALSVSPESITLISADFTYMSFSWQLGNLNLRPIDYLSAEVDLSVGSHSGINAMVSIWDPSVSFDAFGLCITLTGHIGAIGAGLSAGGDEIFSLDFANGLGFGFSISRQ